MRKKCYKIRCPENQNKVMATIMAWGAIDAMEKSGLNEKYRIVCVDNRPDQASIIDVVKKDQSSHDDFVCIF